MWPFSNQLTLPKAGTLRGLTDWHCHLLPGVDDGVQTLAQCLRVLQSYEELGVAAVWFTPHIMEDIPNTPEQLQRAFDEVRAAYRGPISLHLAAEHMLDTLFAKRLQEGRVMPIGTAGDTLLVETSYFNPPHALDQRLDAIRQAGYHPLLAHPERYLYMEGRDYDRLRQLGVKFQLNLGSLTGVYGKTVKLKAQRLLQKGCYDRVGTDLHRETTIQAMLRAKLPAKLLQALPRYSEP